MAHVGCVALTRLCSALALWQKGIKTPQQLTSFSEPHYLACDVPEGHTDGIKARAGGAGEQLAYSNLFQCVHRPPKLLPKLLPNTY